MSLTRYALPTVLSALVLTGCGGQPDGTSAALQDRVGAVVTAVNAGNGDAARLALGALRDDVAAAQRLDAITPERAAEVLAAATAVEAGLPVPAPPAPQPATEPPVPQSEPPAQNPDKDDEQKDDKGKKDDDKDDD